MNEEEFWRSTPRKVGKLFDIHSKFNGWNMSNDNNKNTGGDVVYKKVNITDIPCLN